MEAGLLASRWRVSSQRSRRLLHPQPRLPGIFPTVTAADTHAFLISAS